MDLYKLFKNNSSLIIFVISVIFLFVYWFFIGKYKKGSWLLYDIQTSKRSRRSRNGEEKTRSIIENMTGKPFPSVRPNFLKNPKTGRNLELDMYNSEYKIAIEYQGGQHIKYTPYFHRSYQDFLDLQERDRIKKILCEKNGIKLIYVDDSIKDIEGYLRKKLE